MKKSVFSVIASKSLNLICLTFSEQYSNLKPDLNISHKDRKHIFANTSFKLSTYALVNHIVVMMAAIHISQEIFAESFQTFSGHDRKHAVRLRRLYGDQV